MSGVHFMFSGQHLSYMRLGHNLTPEAAKANSKLMAKTRDKNYKDRLDLFSGMAQGLKNFVGMLCSNPARRSQWVFRALK